MTAPTRITLTDYQAPFAEFPPALRAFATAEGIPLPSLDSHMGQALALLAQPENAGRRYCTREDCEHFLTAIGFPSGDPIQAFNKFPQKGFELGSRPRSGQYMLPFPFVANHVHRKKRAGAALTGDRDADIAAIKDFWRQNLTEVPNDRWQVGHLDPTKPDGTAENLAWQPPLQAVYRDRFKWDTMFHKMWPTGAELRRNMDGYYTEAEQRALLEFLKARWSPDASSR